MRSTLPRLALLGLVLAGLTLSACGRRGPLEAPPGGNELPGDDKAETPDVKPGPDGRPATAQVRAGRGRAVQVQVPRQKFILDPLL